MKSVRSIPLSLALCLGTLTADAQDAPSFVPHVIPIQGYLTDQDGVPVDGAHAVTLTLYKVESGGKAVLEERQAAVTFDAGEFTVFFGDRPTTALDFSALTNLDELWVAVSIDDELLSPRFRLGAVPYAGAAEICGNALTLGGMSPSAFATADHTHAWKDLTGVPASFADGVDNDSIASVSCAAGTYVTQSGGQWTCAHPSASDLSGGTISTSLYSAYADLQSENRLSDADTSLLTRVAADSRYLSNVLTPTYTTTSASDGATTTKSLSGRFCALSFMQAGAASLCSVTGSGPFTLTATAANNQSANCTAVCF
jgi:hypothetical protein